MIIDPTGKNPALWIFKRNVVMPNPMSPRGAGLALGCADMVFDDVKSDQLKQMYDFYCEVSWVIKVQSCLAIKIAQNIKQVFKIVFAFALNTNCGSYFNINPNVRKILRAHLLRNMCQSLCIMRVTSAFYFKESSWKTESFFHDADNWFARYHSRLDCCCVPAYFLTSYGSSRSILSVTLNVST